MAVLFFAAIFFKLPMAIASVGWPTTEGVVVLSEVGEGGSGQYTEGWWPRVSYRYSVNGREYTSDSVEVEDVGNGNTDRFAWQVVQRYPAGKHVKVYYDPRDPSIAVLEPGIPNNEGGLWSILTLGVIGIGSLLVCIGLLGVFGLIRLPVKIDSTAT